MNAEKKVISLNDACILALEIATELITKKTWAEDDWVSLSENYDLNVYLEKPEYTRGMSIYRVENGNTITDNSEWSAIFRYRNVKLV